MIQIDMPMPEKCSDCIFCDENCSCVASDYDGLGINVGCAYRTGRRDIRCPLREQEAEWFEVDDKHDAFDCSNCGAMAGRKCLYCPGCGAKMKNGTRAMESQ